MWRAVRQRPPREPAVGGLEMGRPSQRATFAISIAVLVTGSIALALHAFAPPGAGQRSPDITLATLCLPAGLALLVAQAMSFPTLGHRLVAAIVLFGGGFVFTAIVMFVLGCGFYGACSK